MDCVPSESVEEGISRSTIGVENKAKLQIKLKFEDDRRGCKNPLPVKLIKGVSRPPGQRCRNQMITSKKGTTLKAAIAAFSLALSSKLGSSNGRIVLNEAQATM
ncbi:hypothetical protein HYC85_026557 [Camellia sinensis]|uniref:Uncharacterized protein n=1 Tax=Camellia sinensis TaxID=4442 RepID=A0A7J7G7L4_CAMSI|nr:hypothetical protein HYC85_026557 [Camellia sinensis]